MNERGGGDGQAEVTLCVRSSMTISWIPRDLRSSIVSTHHRESERERTHSAIANAILVKLFGLENVISSSSSNALFLVPTDDSTLSLFLTPPLGGTYPGGSPSLILDPVGDAGTNVSSFILGKWFEKTGISMENVDVRTVGMMGGSVGGRETGRERRAKGVGAESVAGAEEWGLCMRRVGRDRLRG